MTELNSSGRIDPAIQAEIVARKDAGASWKELQEQYGLTRQQARYAYQQGKRTERRAAARAGNQG